VPSGIRQRVAYGGRLLVVEDSEVTYRSLDRIVSRYRQVRHASTFATGLAELRARTDWCGFLFERRLPDAPDGGLDLLAIARKELPGVPAAIVNGYPDPTLVPRVEALGGVLLSKTLGEQDLLPFLQRVISREHGFAREFGERLDLVSRAYRFSPREHEILAWFVAGGSRDGYLAFTGMAETTLKTHVKHMLAKASCASLSDIVAEALRRVVVRHSKSRPPPHLFEQVPAAPKRKRAKPGAP
jgi:DNA-binding CsgD family transcriptional regulator